MKDLGVWAKLGAGLTVLWIIGFGAATYLNLVTSVTEEQRLGKLWCPSSDANCLAANVSHWVGASHLLLAAYAIAETVSIAAVVWTMIALGFAAWEWGVDSHQAVSGVG